MPNNLRFVSVQTRGSFSHPQSDEKQEEEEEPEESFEEIRIPKSWLNSSKALENNRFTGPMAHIVMSPADKNKDNQSFKVCHP
ncbi:hypothetical protein L1987_74577 [Smallanthus sonchifolius]|uniref:Uncharacterized protein n=1 Tax=Smallanthus sonchifolius TaxID=185202 RepID=A0ACB9A326_9ASTR|nr:hypothetical protein L1987_74577 [Smallanthus sonchifolius]